jgi:hypothetical protein
MHVTGFRLHFNRSLILFRLPVIVASYRPYVSVAETASRTGQIHERETKYQRLQMAENNKT